MRHMFISIFYKEGKTTDPPVSEEAVPLDG
jgi:hypothetical protein